MRQAETTPRYKQAFLLALLTAALVFLPFVILDKGYFVYYGDFNVQQIPFYKLVHESIRSGDVLWSWYTDLGANFIGSYSFYNLFSPFFWLTLPFPTEWVPLFMAPLLVLKTACASLTAYCYLERFFRDTRYAVLGGLLYAFSGWMVYNVFFNHFHEAAIFFPLLLLGVEKLAENGGNGFFAVTVAVAASVNYWFFAGEAVFVVLYVFVRLSDKAFGMTPKKFLRLCFEAVLGVCLSAVVLAPSVLALSGNPRTGFEKLLSGWYLWHYSNAQRYLAIFSSILLPPELPARPNLFPDHGAKWASLSGWLPLFGATGMLAFFFGNKNSWIKKILAISLLFALVPGLNSLFVLLNDSYYARWFFMPLLLAALATAKAVEQADADASHFRRAMKWVFGLILATALICGLTPTIVKDEPLEFGLAKEPPLMWAWIGAALLALLLAAILMLHVRRGPSFQKIAAVFLLSYSAVFMIFFMAAGRMIYERTDYIVTTAIGGREQIDLPNEPFARSDAFEAGDNLLMFWHLPNIQAFHSIVPVSIMEFYPEVGVTRDVGSRPESKFIALRPLLSVRWLFIEAAKEEQEPMQGYRKYSEQAGYNVYENENYLPMGFSYDEYITLGQLEDVTKDNRSNMMLRAIVLDGDGVTRNRDILSNFHITGDEYFDYQALEEDVAARRGFTADTFSVDSRGFSAETNFTTERLVFFSVPWEKGWSATVNGEPAQIERANIGFMAVRVPAGKAEIRFDYFTPGLKEGAYISAAALLVLIAYALLARRRKNKAAPAQSPAQVRDALANGREVKLSMQEYESMFGNRYERSLKLRRAFDEAAERKRINGGGDFTFSLPEDIAPESGENVDNDSAAP